MKKLIAVISLPLLLAFSAHSQSGSVKGTITDSVENKSLANTVISLLRSKDSVLVKFARADKDGQFSINGLKEGQFILMATHPYLGDYFDNIEVKENASTDLGKIYMTPKSKLLAEVILKSGAPIRIKGDTTIYTADSFKVRPGANVEELLRRLPGIQVDRSGQITAMGERVTKVLVDGEEFFGSDPGIATKNLRADAVKEVQVFDKKSDQAEFTGIDDGVKDKTINLKMKELTGYFGKIEAGGGIKNKYNNDAMFNAFKGKRKMAAYGIMSNTGQTNLDWQDTQNYTAGEADGMQTGVSADGSIFMMFGGGSGDDSYWGGRNGIPKNWNAGLHYSNKFNGDKLSVNSGYKFSGIDAPGNNTTFSQVFLSDSSWTTDSRNNFFSSTDKQAFNMTIESNIDSLNSLKWTTRFNNNTGKSSSDYYSESLDNQSRFINNSTRSTTTHSDKNNIASTLLWRRKFKKLSRTLSINTDFNWTESKTNGFLYSLNNYYTNGTLDHMDTTDQQNIQNSNGNSITTKIAYTEPLTKDAYLEISYSLGYNGNSNERITNFKNFNGKYENLVDTLSNSFAFNRLVSTPGLNFRVNKKKYNYSFGTSVGFNHFIQNNVTSSTKTNYNFTNYFPLATFNYRFKPTKNFRCFYSGASIAPSLEQLQPTQVNTDPLNIYVGNPSLKQSFRHAFGFTYNSSNVLKQKSFLINMRFGSTQNAFTQLNTISAGGKRMSQTVNADGIYNFNLYSFYSFTMAKWKIDLSLGPMGGINRNIDFVKDENTGVINKNATTSKNYGINFGLDKYVQNKYNFSMNNSFTWNQSKATINSSANAEYWSLSCQLDATANLPHNFDLSSNMNLQIRQKDPRFTQNSNYTTWNASLTKRMLKDNALEIKFEIVDILDQNKGYSRNFNSYSFTESYYTTLRRYCLLTLTWNISKNGKPLTNN